MCNPSNQDVRVAKTATASIKAVVESKPAAPSMVARYTTASVLAGIFAVWGKYTFVEKLEVGDDMHSYMVPLIGTTFYLVSLPILRAFGSYFGKRVDMKLLLTESMILYNASQVVLNGWMVYKMVNAVLFNGHPFVGNVDNFTSGASYAVWVHYCDKYLEFFDTYFMVLRGKMDQVSFLHVYHHFSISWAWWVGVRLWPAGDNYFGALLNSLIHVMMYSYYTLSLLKISCPWKKYLTMAQLIQFTSVVVYSIYSWLSLPENATWKQHVCLSTQTFEMVSLFVLFFLFFRKTYKQKKPKIAGEKHSSSQLPAIRPISSSASD